MKQIMKKFSLFCALLVGIAVMTGCQKDQDTVTLKAVVDQNTKAYFGGSANSLPYWDGNDRVYLKGSTRDFTRTSCRLENLSTTFATISGVPISNVYCAIFPASAVQDMGTPYATGTTAKINFKHDQVFIWDEANQRQRLEMPMGAVSTNNTLIFKNLCGILRVKVVNNTSTAFDVTRLSVISEDGTFIAGDGNITLSQNGDPQISMSPYHITNVDQAIQLHNPEGYSSMGTIPASSTNNFKEFDIIVPPFSCDELTFDVETSEHGFFSHTVDHAVHVDRNEIATITLTIGQFSVNNHAYLIEGPTFNTRIKSLSGINNVTMIKFTRWGYNINNFTHVNLEAAYSPLPVYGFIDGTTLVIYTNAVELYANPSCRNMFKDLTSVQNIQTVCTFITEDVVDMSYMFAGCRSLSITPGSGGLGDFNTTNVETMAHMFDGCSAMGQFDLTSYNTQHLRPNGMVAMFNGCTNLTTLDLSSFTTEQITDMSDLFNGCESLTLLKINKFDMSNVSNKTNMCLNLGADARVNMYSGEQQNPCKIYCTDNTQTALRGNALIYDKDDYLANYKRQQADPTNPEAPYLDPTTKLNTSKVEWHIVAPPTTNTNK